MVDTSASTVCAYDVSAELTQSLIGNKVERAGSYVRETLQVKDMNGKSTRQTEVGPRIDKTYTNTYNYIIRPYS